MKTTHSYPSDKVFALICLSFVLLLVSCKEPGPAEKAGKAFDDAKESVSDKSQKAAEYVDDAAITAKIKETMINDDFLKASQIEVTTVNGAVKLSGAVDSEQLIGRAIGLANTQQNVKSVQNLLTVKAGAEAR